MKFAAFVFGCILWAGFVLPARAQVSPSAFGGARSSPWWVSFEPGAGQLRLSSDQIQGNRTTLFALGFAGGYRPMDMVRVGLHLNGWLLQAFDLNNPTVGESVSNTGLVVDVFPMRRTPLFARGGFGLSTYTNNRPLGINGRGPGWEAGSGYEIPIHGRVNLVPMVEWAEGGLGTGSPDTFPTQTGLHYSVFEFKLAVVGSFGHRRSRAVTSTGTR